MGRKGVSTQLYNKSRDIIYPLMDQVGSDLDVACCFGYIAMYLVSIGDLQQAIFFKKNAELCEKLSQNSNDSVDKHRQAQWLRYYLMGISSQLDDNFDIFSLFPLIVSHINIDTSDTNEVTAGSSTLVSAIEKLKNLKNDDVVIKNMMFTFVSNGAKLKHMRLGNKMDGHSALQIANTITEQIKQEGYAELTSFVVMAVAEAAIVHSYWVLNKRTTELVESLRWDIWGLNIMAERHFLVKQRYSTLLNTLNQTLGQ
jgi:hypothetical protein